MVKVFLCLSKLHVGILDINPQFFNKGWKFPEHLLHHYCSASVSLCLQNLLQFFQSLFNCFSIYFLQFKAKKTKNWYISGFGDKNGSFVLFLFQKCSFGGFTIFLSRQCSFTNLFLCSIRCICCYMRSWHLEPGWSENSLQIQIQIQMVTSFTWKYVAGSGGPRQHVDSCSKSAVDKMWQYWSR